MKVRKIFIATIVLLGLFLIILGLPLIFAFGKSGGNTTILGKDYSTLNKTEVIEKLGNDFDFDKTIKLTAEGRVFEIKMSSISAQIDNERMASTILYRRLNLGVKRYIIAFFQKREFDLEVNWDKNKLGEEINRIAQEIDKPLIPTEVVNDNGQIEIKDGEIGIEVDKDRLALEIVETIKKYLIEESREIPIKTLGVAIPSEDQKNKAIELAKKIMGKKIILTWENNKSEVLSDTIIGWIGFEDNNCNKNKINQFIISFNDSIKQEPRNAVFKFENNKVTQFESSRDGYVIDTTEMSKNLCQILNDWSDSEEVEVKYDLPLLKTQASIKTGDVNDLGIKELIGRGTSSFSHSSAVRNMNVEKGAEIVNRVLVAPNETFSFIKSLGEVSLDNGFKQAYVINKGRTVLDVGGGVCQVSTTLFRAMLDAGLNITDRKSHAYRVSYYEEDSKPGFDATVFIPNPDLKFVNDTGNYILIQSFYDGKKKTLAYEIYGTKDGRSVEISNYKQWDASPAPPDVWIDDPTLAPGKVVKDESRVPGLKTSFDWKVTKDGEILHQKTYVSVYRPWAAVYRRGPQI